MFGWKDIGQFHFEWPWALLLLLLLPLWWIFYVRSQKQRLQQLALQFSYASVAAQIGKTPAAWKRLLFPIAVSVLMLGLIVALARPTVVAQVPVRSVDMMLVLDISLSMLAEDIKPDRLSAAKEAAIRFVDSLPRDTRIGLEVFAGDNYVLSPPTSKHAEIKGYLHALQREDLKPRTEIGSALHTATRILQGQADAAAAEPPSPDSNDSQQTAPKARPDQVIILLSDGDSQEGYPWNRAALDAKAANIRIHTIGVGSEEGTTIIYQGMELPVLFNEETLRQIAEIADGSYFRVFKESDFRRVYEQIRERTIHYEERSIDLAFLAAGFSLFVLLAALMLGARRVI